MDGSGNLYIADTGNHRIRKVDAEGTMTTVEGAGEEGYGGDGRQAIQALLNSPLDVAVDGSGNLYIADTGNHRIRKVDADGIITTVAGDGEEGYGGDNDPAIAAQLNSPVGVAADGAGNLYIADWGNRRIRKIDAMGWITTVAGNGSDGCCGDDKPAIEAWLGRPWSVAVDGAGNLYSVSRSHQRVRWVDAVTGIIDTIAGTGTKGYGGDGGPATAAELSDSRGVAVDGAGNLYIADSGNDRIRRVDAATKNIDTVAGGVTGDGGPAVAAQLNSPRGVATDGAGNLYIADTLNYRVRKIDIAGNISTVAGDGTRGFSGDGRQATEAQMDFPYGAAVDGAGNLYIADLINHRVRRVDAAGNIDTVAGDGEQGYGGDGEPALQAQLQYPIDVALDGAGNLYIADRDNHRIRRVDADGIITTVAGSGEQGYDGDGESATAAQLAHPHGMTVDEAGNLYIADTFNHRIRKVDADGIITTVAGSGEEGYDGDGGPAIEAQLDSPHDVALDGAGNLYIADRDNHRIRWVDADGKIDTVAGSGEEGYDGDGDPAVGAQLDSPHDVALDGAGNLYIADSGNDRIRRVSPPPTAALTANPTQITSGQSTTLTWASTNAVSARIDNGVGTVSPPSAGSTTVSPTSSTTYTLTVTDANGAQAAASVTITVTAPPTAVLTATDATITSGQSTTLEWASTNAVSARIDNGVGAVSPAAGGSTSVSPTATTTYTLTVTDANGAVAQAGATVTVTDSGPPPTAALSANPTQITSGQSTTLTWTASNAVSAEIDNGVGAVSPAAGGSTSVSPTATTTYTLTVSAADGRTAQASVTITVTAPPAAVLSADPPTITSGQSSTLRVAASNAVSAVIQPGNLTVSLDPSGAGSVSVSPETTTEYTLTVTDANNAVAIATATITVTAPPTAALSANPTEIAGGESSTLTWTASNAVSARIDNGVGAVSPAAGGSTSVSPTATTTYTPTVTDANGAVAQAGATVTVTDSGPPPTAALSASPTQIASGQSSTLTWTASNAVSARIDNGVGAVSPAAGGSTSVSPTATTTYTLTVSAADGRTAQASVTVTVDDGDPPPAVTLSANPTAIAEGESSTLIWTSTHATSAAIDQGIGPVALSGARQVSPTRTTAYTITVRNSDGMTAAATVSVTVTGPPEEPQLPVVRARTIELSFVLPQDAAPAAQPVVLYAENGAADFRAQPGPNWLAAEPASGSLAEDEETTIAVTVDPAGLPVERRRGLLYIRSGGRITDRVRVVLEVLPPLGPAVHEAVNAAAMSASGEPGLFGPTLLPLAPGSMVALRGENFLDRSFAEDEFIVSGSFPLPANLDGVRVSFDGVAARLFAAGPQRIYAQLPSALVSEALAQGMATATVTVETAAGESYPRRFPIGAHGPGIFTLSGQGTGQAAVVLAGTTVLAAAPGFDGEIQLEQPGEMVDIYTTSRPARAGEIVEIYATGLGAVEPPIADGANSCEPESVCAADFSNVVLRHTVERPQVWIGGVEVADEDILFSGLAPTLAAMNMVVARVPEGIEPSNAAEAIISIGGRTSQPGVTIAVE